VGANAGSVPAIKKAGHLDLAIETEWAVCALSSFRMLKKTFFGDACRRFGGRGASGKAWPLTRDCRRGDVCCFCRAVLASRGQGVLEGRRQGRKRWWAAANPGHGQGLGGPGLGPSLACSAFSRNEGNTRVVYGPCGERVLGAGGAWCGGEIRVGRERGQNRVCRAVDG